MISIPDRWLPVWKATAQHRVTAWKLTRTDGTVYRFTSTDQPIWIDGEKYLPRDDQADTEESGGGEFTGEKREAALAEHAVGLSGVISSSSITEEDLAAGRYDDATVAIHWIDRRNTAAGSESRDFQVADTSYSTDGGWRFSLVSAIDAKLQQKRGEVASRTCRSALFGERCARDSTDGAGDALIAAEWAVGVVPGDYCEVLEVVNAYTVRVGIVAKEITDLQSPVPNTIRIVTTSNHYFLGPSPGTLRPLHVPMLLYGNVGASPSVNATYTSVTTGGTSEDVALIINGSEITTAGSTLGFVCLAPQEDWFARGFATWIGGGNNLLASRVQSSTAFNASPSGSFGGDINITFDVAPPATIQVGDVISLAAGCDKQLQTCDEKFGNSLNFNGDPFAPGSEIFLDTPSTR